VCGSGNPPRPQHRGNIEKQDRPFSSAVANALKTAQFAPAEIDGGTTVPYWAIVEYFFSLGPPSAVAQARGSAEPLRAPPPRQPSVGK
jgi:hypothetical protein